MKQQYRFINVLKAFAAIIIINSHFDSLYPIKEMATGGAIGNGLFFCISGFLLYPLGKNFRNWISVRILNIYVPTILLVVVSLFTTKKGSLGELGLFKCFIWPTLFWFVGAIVLFYFLYYLFRNVKSERQFIIFFTSLAIVNVIYYIFLLDTSKWVIESNGLNSVEGYYKLIYYFAIMMMGKWIRIYRDPGPSRGNGYVIGAIISFISIYVEKWLMQKNPFFYHVQIINQISIIVFIYCLFMYLAQLEDKLLSVDNTFNSVIEFLGKHTLEMYLTQFVIILYCERIPFPINAFLAFCLIFLAAYILKRVSNLLLRCLMKKKRKGC